MIQKIRRPVVGYENIRPAVAIIITTDYTQTLSLRISYTRRHRHIGKCAVPIVMVQQIRHAVIYVRVTVRTNIVPHTALIAIEGEIHIPTHKQIKMAVPVIVQERGTR